ncbi:MAG: hypothetical protein GY953_21475, partial [bacterium]|nr:hypothetical protein [bacterium]
MAIAAFDRDASSDPRADATVRGEARRLRAKLREYYETEGQDDPVRIEVPKGSYVPAFRPNRARVEAAAARPEATTIAVLPFINLSQDAENEYFSGGLTEELINTVVSIPGLRVTSRTSGFAFK